MSVCLRSIDALQRLNVQPLSRRRVFRTTGGGFRSGPPDKVFSAKSVGCDNRFCRFIH
jgi:hypothetical protein